MEHWMTIMTFQHNHEAYLVKTKLESEGIVVNLLDEYISQIQPFYAAAAGGIKLQVKGADVIKAKYILSEMGLMKQFQNGRHPMMEKVDQATSKIPLLNLEARLLIILAIVLMIIVIPIFLAQA